MLSVQLPPQKEDMPEIEYNDVVMSDPNPTEVQSQDQASDGMDEIQVITRDAFDNPRDGESAKDLIAASELLGETAVKQKPDIESLLIKVDVLGNKLEAAHRDQQSIASELGKTQTRLADTAQALLKSKERARTQSGTIKKLQADLKESKGNVRAEKAINSDLQEKLATSRVELTKCMDDVFSLQPMIPVADSRVVKELEIVGQEVVHWIETEVGTFEKAHPEAGEDFIFSVFNNRDAAIFLKDQPGAGEHLARYLIHRFLKVNLFGRKFNLLGLTKEIAQMLQNVEHSMAKFDPPRGTSDRESGVSATTTDNRQVLLVS